MKQISIYSVIESVSNFFEKLEFHNVLYRR